jgi:hypothetical protein
MGWSALIPGIREIRGPLLGGYLWMLAIWLSIGDRLPTSKSSPVFERLWEAGEVLGPIGRAAAVSVVAYLLGELVDLVINDIRFRIFLVRRRQSPWQRSTIKDFMPTARRSKSWWGSVEEIGRRLNPERVEVSSDLPLGTRLQLFELEDAELGGAKEDVAGGVHHAVSVTSGGARCRFRIRPDGVQLVGLPRVDRDLVELPMPRFSASIDIWQKRPLIETRLREIAAQTAGKIERLYSEASLRTSLAPPLIALIIIVAIDTSLGWLLLLAVPVALLMHARSLRAAATHQLIDALRARSGTEELEKVTPIFAKYRLQATQLSRALIEANWGNLAALESESNGEAER